MVQFKILVALFTLTSANYDSPISPAEYSIILGHGFATSYFSNIDKVPHRYSSQQPVDVFAAGFQNLRIRTGSRLFKSNDSTVFKPFLNALETVVDDCLKANISATISWADEEAEVRANDDDRKEYVRWWRKVAERLKDKDYRLSFNMFTELTKVTGLYLDINKYKIWTTKAVNAIRGTGGKNGERIVILASPKKSAQALSLIDPSIYETDKYMMVEWHEYAGGPNHKILQSGRPGPKHWTGCGTDEQKQGLRDSFKAADSFTKETGLPSYFGAWTPMTIKGDTYVNNTEAKCFACFATELLKKYSVPWTLNALHLYYDRDLSKWNTDDRELPNDSGNYYDTGAILNEIKRCRK